MDIKDLNDTLIAHALMERLHAMNNELIRARRGPDAGKYANLTPEEVVKLVVNEYKKERALLMTAMHRD